MRFALLGNHPDGLNMAAALRATGRHELAAYCGPKAGADLLQSQGWSGRLTGDLEEVLADPAVEAGIVAGPPATRAAQLRRALQSERHVLCVHPADQSPDAAYEASMIQGDTGRVLLPLLGGALNPAVRQLAAAIRQPAGPYGALKLIQWDCAAVGPVLLDGATAGFKPALPIWDVLRALGGEVAEVSAFAGAESVAADEPVLAAGRFASGAIFQATLLPGQAGATQRLTAFGAQGAVQLADEPGWSPWPALVEVFEAATSPPTTGKRPALAVTWQDEVRALELDEAARRSVERRRASTLDYQEVSEEVGFKGTMTLVGCGLLWGLLLLLVLAAWDKRFLWLVVPTLVIFLGLQLLRWLIPAAPEGTTEPGSDNPPPSP